MAVRLYPYGFLLTDRPAAISDLELRGFSTEHVWDEIFLYKQKDEPCTIKGDFDCGLIWLGHGANTADHSSGDIAEDAYQALQESKDSFEQLLDYSVGRWACVVFLEGRGYVYNDMLASQPVYIHRESFLLSSHLPLLTEEIDTREGTQGTITRLGQHRLWDETEDARAAALPPNFVYDLQQRRLTRYYPHAGTSIDDAVTQESLDSAIQLAQRSVKHWLQQPLKTHCALTAGIDTRLCAAVALSVSKDLTFVTYGSVSPPSPEDGSTARSYKIDVRFSQQIAEAFSVPHITLPIEDAGEFGLSEEEKSILSRSFHGQHAAFFRGLYENTLGRQPSLCFVGSGFEGFRDYYVSANRPIPSSAVFKKITGAVAGFSESRRGYTLSDEQAHELWERYDYDTVLDSGYPVSNMLYMELRAGRFQSEAINSQTSAFLPINPLAIRKVFEKAQAHSFYNRKKNLFSKRIVESTYPALAGFPVNGKPFHVEEIRTPGNVTLHRRKDKASDSAPIHQTLPDIVQLSEDELFEGGEVFFRGIQGSDHSSDHEALCITIHNPYDPGRTVSNIVHFVRVDGTDLAIYPIGTHPEPLTLTLTGLAPGAQVDVGVRSTKKNGSAWTGVSRTQLLAWDTYPTKADQELGVNATRPCL
ncbi:hypothetical protein F7230_06395 [Corynebacterium sp. 320]|uniref:hypothetical protein n=1 Tax=Corynebacterium TaxID=1716 RepID=UPI00125CAA67|nr:MULTISPECIES: hypothetical protein [Corynebacterium]KAB1503160.1 hypothetical protein F7230_06395 [Corynebacterium sp. 320]KAB1550626.1 hypothetical protein F7233_08790 [Corynebacterium sp. 321]KAB1550988.1 hypothetical protein F7232_07970 [Corynebacterium sp. 319]KAB3526957.1 hypothetical protein F8354_06395 [Corynebacterium sp. 250]KAB3538450.1 hypothetical protein F8390_09295 [Corynebacterium sp. 366]